MDEQKAKSLHEFLERVILERWYETYEERKNKCPECEDGTLEHQFTLTVGNSSGEYWKCNNCTHSNARW